MIPLSVGRSELRTVAPEAKSLATGVLGVEHDREVIAKDRFVVDSRTFEVIALVTPDADEWLRRVLVREVQQPERVLYLCLKPENHDGASSTEPLPELVKVMPYAHITDKPVEMVRETEGGGVEAANLKQIQASEIAASYFSEGNLERLLYCLMAYSDVEVTAAAARAREFPRYRFNGSPVLESYRWASDFPMSITLVEER